MADNYTGFFNVKSIIDIRYYDYIQGGYSGREMTKDPAVYDPVDGLNGRYQTNPLNRLIFVKAQEDDDLLPYDYIINPGHTYNIFLKTFTNDVTVMPSTINSWIVEAYKTENSRGEKITAYRLPGEGEDLNELKQLITNTSASFYDEIPVMGIIPFNARGFLHNGQFGEHNILVRRLNHKDISDWDDAISDISAGSGSGEYPLRANFSHIDVSVRSNLRGFTYIDDLYIKEPQGTNYVSIYDLIHESSQTETVDASLSEDLTVSISNDNIGSIVNGTTFPKGTALEQIIRDLLIERFCTESYIEPVCSIISTSYKHNGTILSSTSELRSPEAVIEFEVNLKFVANYGPMKDVSIYFKSAENGRYILEPTEWNVDNDTRSMTKTITGRIIENRNLKIQAQTYYYTYPDGTLDTDAKLIIDSKNCYNGYPLNNEDTVSVTWKDNSIGKGYGKAPVGQAESTVDKLGNTIISCRGKNHIAIQPGSVTMVKPIFYKAMNTDINVTNLTTVFDNRSGNINSSLINGWTRKATSKTLTNIPLPQGTAYFYIVAPYSNINSVTITSQGFTSTFTGYSKLSKGIPVHYVDNNETVISDYNTYKFTWPETDLVGADTTITINFN